MTETQTKQADTWTILRLLHWTTEHLKKHGSSTPRLDAEVLLAHARSCERIQLYTSFAEEPEEPVKATFRELIRRRAAGEPVAYLVGKKEFYSLSFQVSKDCLIPRPETEHLVIECLDRAKKMRADESARPLTIVDACTGSGCVAITIAKHLDHSNVIAIDISTGALAIAQSNVEQHRLGARVSVIHGDLLHSIPNDSADFVVSNPPYVSESEYLVMDTGVREHEPKIALVSGPTGTELIERLVIESETRLKPGGWFLCELSPMIADPVQAWVQARPNWNDIAIVKDLAGQKRLMVARRASAP